MSLLALPVTAEAQVDDLMQREIDEALEASLWQAGAFRLTPVLRVGGGVDSNPLARPGPDPVEDVNVLLGPGVRGVVPLGIRGLVNFYQEVDFVYYRDLEQLRDVFNVSRAGGAIGGRDFVLRVDGEFRTGQVRPTSEVDVPLEEDRRSVGGGLDIALGSAQQLNLRYDNVRQRYEDPVGDVAATIPNRLDRTQEFYELELERYVTGTTSFVVQGTFELIDYVNDATERDGRGYGARAGFEFSPRGDIRGRALLGYERRVPDADTQAEFSGLVGSVDATFPLGNVFRLRGLFLRGTQPSVLLNNWFFVENRAGAWLDVYLAERWFVRPGVVFGTNTYPRASTFENEQGRVVTEVVEDEFQIYAFSINYELRPDVVLSLGVDQQNRSSNLPSFDKDRLIFRVGLATDF